MANSSSTLPLGVAILAVLIGIVGFVYVLVGLLLLIHFGALGGLALFGQSTLGSIIVLVLGIVLLVVARGLWDLEVWALALAVLVVLLLLAGNVYSFLTGGGASIISMIVEVLLLVYLIAVSNRFT